MNRIAVAALAVFACSAAQSDTLEKIRRTQVVTMGVRDSSGALSYYVGGKYVGFHVELCQRALADVQKKLNLPSLGVKYQLVSSANRIPLLQNETIDIECGSTTNNLARQQQVSFAVTTFVEQIRMAVRSDSGINRAADLSGRTVTTTSGSTSVQILRRYQKASGTQFKEVHAKDHADSMLILETGRADAFVMDAQDLAGNIMRSRNPKDYKITDEVFSIEPIAIMIRKNDEAFKQQIDASLQSMMKSGEIGQIYDRWFMRPIPPVNGSLNLAASEATKAAWANPNDKPLEEYEQPK